MVNHPNRSKRDNVRVTCYKGEYTTRISNARGLRKPELLREVRKTQDANITNEIGEAQYVELI